MGKIIPRSFEKLRSGEHLQLPTFTTVAAANAAGWPVCEVGREETSCRRQERGPGQRGRDHAGTEPRPVAIARLEKLAGLARDDMIRRNVLRVGGLPGPFFPPQGLPGGP